MVKERDRIESGNVFEGIVSFRAVVDGMKRPGGRRIERLFYDREKLKKNAREFSYIKAKSAELGFELTVAPRNVIDGMTTGNSHGGIAFYCSEREYPRVTGNVIVENGVYVLLEGIEDPFNFGYALRTVCASGADGVLLTRRTWENASGIVCRSSAGASEMIDIFTLEDENDLGMFRDRGYRVVAADTENAKPMYECDLRRPVLLAVGGEKRGLSRFILDFSDERARIEYGREFPAALSAASAASVLAFEIYRQNAKK